MCQAVFRLFLRMGPSPCRRPPKPQARPLAIYILMINDLRVSAFQTWKYVDDNTVTKGMPQGQPSDIQSAVHAVENWSYHHKKTLNADECKVMNIDIKQNRHAFLPVIIDEKELSVVNSAKILGVTLSSDLTWNDHMSEVIKGANKRLYFLVFLKKVGVSPCDIVNFYCTIARPCTT